MKINNEGKGEVNKIISNKQTNIIFVGFPSANEIGIYSYEKATMKAQVLKYIAIDFRTFEMDEWCSMLIAINDNSRELQLYSIEWAFDIS